MWHDIATGRKVDEREDEKFRSGDLDSPRATAWVTEAEAEAGEVRPPTAATERPATPSDADEDAEDAAPDGWHYMLNEWLPHAQSSLLPLPSRGAELAGAACASCGVNAAHESGAPNCCSQGGSWEGMCDEAGEHTWHEGFQACSVTSEAARRLTASSQAQETKANWYPRAWDRRP